MKCIEQGLESRDIYHTITLSDGRTTVGECARDNKGRSERCNRKGLLSLGFTEVNAAERSGDKS